MKKKLLIIISLVSLLGFLACHKGENDLAPLSSLTVVNANSGIGNMQVKYWNGPVLWHNYNNSNVAYGGNTLFTLPPGNQSMMVVSSTDTLHPVFDGNITTLANGVYTLFLSGQSTTTDTLLIKESYPFHAILDSSCGVRFINLSPNSHPLNIRLTGSADPAFGPLIYRQLTGFKNYPAKKVNSSYSFDIRDAVTDTLVTSYALSTPYFNNVTLALEGLEGQHSGTNALKVIRINNY